MDTPKTQTSIDKIIIECEEHFDGDNPTQREKQSWMIARLTREVLDLEAIIQKRANPNQ